MKQDTEVKFPAIAGIKSYNNKLIAEVFITERDKESITFSKCFSSPEKLKAAGEYIQSIFNNGGQLFLEQWLAIEWK